MDDKETDPSIPTNLGSMFESVKSGSELMAMMQSLIQETRKTNARLDDAAGWREFQNRRVSKLEEDISMVKDQVSEVKTDILHISHQVQEVALNARHSVELIEVQFKSFSDILKSILNKGNDKPDVNVNLNNNSTNSNNTPAPVADSKKEGTEGKSKKGFFFGLSGLIGGAGLLFEKEVIDGASRIISFFSNLLKGNT